jgi:hypothetical protein
LHRKGGDVTAERYAYLNFGRDIEDLADEELATIPSFLLDPYLAARGQS